MRIGIDIDGVIADIERFILDYGTKFRYDNNITTKICEGEYNTKKSLGLTNSQEEKFWNLYLTGYAMNYPVRDFATEVINKLKKEHEIYIITARNEYGLPPETYGTMQSMVKNWLKDNQIKYDKLIFAEEKLPVCLENKIDIMIEDSPDNINSISTKIPILCFDCSYNKKVKGENIKRVYGWYDILQEISN